MSDANAPDISDDTGSPAATPVDRLPRAQVFGRDPEEMTQAHLDFVVEEIRKINVRNRKARADDSAVADAATKMKKANAAARKKKAPVPAANILDTQL